MVYRLALRIRRSAWAGLAALAVWACSSDATEEEDTTLPDAAAATSACEPEKTRTCELNGCVGEQICLPDGTEWSACVCENAVEPIEAGGPEEPGRCQLASLPPPPDVQDAGGGRDIFVAMSDLSYGSAEATLGFNLRDATGAPSCERPMLPEEDDELADDDDCAVDNALGRWMAADQELDPEAPSELIRRGRTSMLIRLRDYNGAADDDQVTVSLLATAPFDALGTAELPAFDGEDRWPVLASTLADPHTAEGNPLDTARATDTSAYVTGHRLVARFPSADLRLPLAFEERPRVFPASLTHVVLTCATRRDAEGRWHLDDCLLGASWSVPSLLGAATRSESVGTPDMCVDTPYYTAVRQEVCVRADASTRDAPGFCDALSIGMRFSTTPAYPGNVYESVLRETTCEPELDPAGDSCTEPLGGEL